MGYLLATLLAPNVTEVVIYVKRVSAEHSIT